MADVEFLAGNTRLRARLAQILTDDRLDGWGGRSLPELAEVLPAIGVPIADAGANGGADGGRALPVEVTTAQVLAAVDARRDARLRAAAAAYQGSARDLVTAIFDEEDRGDLMTLLRAAATDTPVDPVPAAVYGVGRFDETTLRELVAGEPAAIVPRLVAARLPDPDTAAAVGRAWDRFALHGDLDELESTVAVAHAAATRRLVAGLGPAAAPVAEHLAHRRDAVNLVTAVRLRRATAVEPYFLPEGTVSTALLSAVASGREVATVVPVRWRAAVAAAEPRGPDALRRTLDDLVDGAARNPSWRTEPLSARVPLAYAAMVRHEAAQVRRLVVLAADRGRVAA